MYQFLVRSDKQVEGLFRRGQQGAVLKGRPTQFKRRFYSMTYQMISKWDGSSLVEENFHFEVDYKDLRLSKTMFGVGQNRNDLFEINAGKPFQKLIDSCSGFKVLKQSSNRHARTPKDPGTAEFSFFAFYLLTIAPIQHIQHDMLHARHGQ